MRPEVIAAFLSALAAGVSAICAFFNWRLAKEAREAFKADELLFAGVPTHPELTERSHSQCVLLVPVFNKGARKAAVTGVEVYSDTGQSIPVDWSSTMDRLGQPAPSGHLVHVGDFTTLFIKKRDGEPWRTASIRI